MKNLCVNNFVKILFISNFLHPHPTLQLKNKMRWCENLILSTNALNICSSNSSSSESLLFIDWTISSTLCFRSSFSSFTLSCSSLFFRTSSSSKDMLFPMPSPENIPALTAKHFATKRVFVAIFIPVPDQIPVQ